MGGHWLWSGYSTASEEFVNCIQIAALRVSLGSVGFVRRHLSHFPAEFCNADVTLASMQIQQHRSKNPVLAVTGVVTRYPVVQVLRPGTRWNRPCGLVPAEQSRSHIREPTATTGRGPPAPAPASPGTTSRDTVSVTSEPRMTPTGT